MALVRERTIPTEHRLSAKTVPTFADRVCHVVSVTSLRPYSRFSRPDSSLLSSLKGDIRLMKPPYRPVFVCVYVCV
jgi:hypothetical protein